MRLLLDTHAFIWWLDADPALAEEASVAIGDMSNDIGVSAATIWEIAIKRASGKLAAPAGRSLAGAIEDCGFLGLPITPAHAEAAGALPPHHSDPFDRMLVAQAMIEGRTLVTRDPTLSTYGVPTLSA